MENNDEKFCAYCHSPISEEENFIKIGEQYFHYDKKNPTLNCYFIEDEEELI